MTTTYRNTSPAFLSKLAAVLSARGFEVSPVVIPENPYTEGNPYITTTASAREIFDARHAAR